jgi:uncharacterized protein YbaP (TraB family)
MRNSSLGRLGNRLGRAASRIAAPLLLAALLSAPSGSPALADDAGNCSGKNILLQLRETDRSRYRVMMDDASKVTNGHSIFWKIEKPGVEPSWLFGTMHSNDARVLELSDKFHDAFDKIDTLVLELKEVSNPNAIAMELFKHPELTMLPADKTLDHLLPADEIAQIAAGLAKKGIPIAAVLRMRPWFLSMGLLTSCGNPNSKDGYVLDRRLAEQAEENGVDVEGLETPLEQFQAMADLSDETMMKELLDVFKLPYSTNDMIGTLIELYSTGNSGLMKAFSEDLSGDKTASLAFSKRVITDRNEVMAERILPYLERGNVMMAVGALHLPGDRGVVELLRKQGFTVTSVD